MFTTTSFIVWPSPWTDNLSPGLWVTRDTILATYTTIKRRREARMCRDGNDVTTTMTSWCCYDVTVAAIVLSERIVAKGSDRRRDCCRGSERQWSKQRAPNARSLPRVIINKRTLQGRGFWDCSWIRSGHGIDRRTYRRRRATRSEASCMNDPWITTLQYNEQCARMKRTHALVTVWWATVLYVHTVQ